MEVVEMHKEIINNSLSNISDSNGFYYGITDKIFKSIIFGDMDMMRWFTSKLVGKKLDKITVRNVEPPVHFKKEKGVRMDVVLEIDENTFVDIEANSSYRKELHMKNFHYLSSLYTQLVLNGEKYEEDRRIIHYDITLGLPKKYKYDVEEIHYQNMDGGKYLRSIVTYIQNVDKIKSHWYNEEVEGIRKYAHILMLVLNEEELNKLVEYAESEDKKYIERFREALVYMNKDIRFRRVISREQEERFMNNGQMERMRKEGEQIGYARGIEQGIEQGHNAGIADAQKETITNMYIKNFSLETISECVNVPLQKVKQIVSSIVL